MMATSADFDAKENIAAINFMEREILKLAKRKGFAGILTTNTNPLTQVKIYSEKSLENILMNFPFSSSAIGLHCLRL